VTQQRFSARGFVKEAEQTALELRSELSVAPLEALDAAAMARHLMVPLLPLSGLDDCAGALYFRGVGSSKFSAALVPIGPTRRGLVYNDDHALVRQRSSIFHEIGHLVLGHKCVHPFLEDGGRAFSSELENEATELGGWLLVTREAALEIARSTTNRVGYGAYAERFGVSVSYLEWRLRVSGALTQATRERAKRAYGSGA
jgi:hypothetical protein